MHQDQNQQTKPYHYARANLASSPHSSNAAARRRRCQLLLLLLLLPAVGDEEVRRALVPGEDLLPDLGEGAEDQVVVVRRVQRQEPMQQVPELRAAHDLVLHDHLEHRPPEVAQRVRRLLHHRHALLHAPGPAAAALAQGPPVPPPAPSAGFRISGDAVAGGRPGPGGVGVGVEEPDAALQLTELAQECGQARRALHTAGPVVGGRRVGVERRGRERGGGLRGRSVRTRSATSPRLRLRRRHHRRHGGHQRGGRRGGLRRGHGRLLVGAVGDGDGLGAAAAAHEAAGIPLDAQPAAPARHHQDLHGKVSSDLTTGERAVGSGGELREAARPEGWARVRVLCGVACWKEKETGCEEIEDTRRGEVCCWRREMERP